MWSLLITALVCVAEVEGRYPKKLYRGNKVTALTDAADFSFLRGAAKSVSPADILTRMSYWGNASKERLSTNFPAQPGKYLSFEHDFGGFNNIRRKKSG